jgi:hypothetical protein
MRSGPDEHSYRHPNQHAHEDTDRNAKQHTNRDPHEDSDGHTNQDPNCHADGNTHHHADCHRYRDSDANQHSRPPRWCLRHDLAVRIRSLLC